MYVVIIWTVPFVSMLKSMNAAKFIVLSWTLE